MYQVVSPYPQFFDTVGRPITGGKVYIGELSKNPTIYPVPVFWDEEGTQPAAQPLRTLGGVIVRNGTPARVYVGQDDYSLSIYDASGGLVSYTAAVTSANTMRGDLSASSGSSLVGFIQSGAGAVARTQQDKDRETVSVFDFMTPAQIADVQSGSPALDVTAAIQAAFTSIRTTRASLHFPKGTYKITSALTLYHPFNVRGAGQEATILQFDGLTGYKGVHGIVIQCDSPVLHAGGYMSDLTLVASNSNGGCALKTPRGNIGGVSIYSLYSPRYCFERLTFRGKTQMAYGRYAEAWNIGIDMGDAREPVIRDCYFMGNFNKDSPTNSDSAADCATSAIFMSGALVGVEGNTSSGAIVSSLIDHCFVYYYGNAVRYRDRVNQGVVRACHLNTCWNGLYSEKSAGSASYAATEYIVSDMQIQAQRHGVCFTDGWIDIANVRSSRSGGYNTGLAWYGFRFENVGYFKINNFRAYGNDADATANSYGVYANLSDYGKISNGTIIGVSTPAMTNAIYLLDSLRFQASNVNIHTAGTGVTFTTAGTTNYEQIAKLSNVLFNSDVTTKVSYNPYVSNKFVELNDNSPGTYTPTPTAVANVAACSAIAGVHSRQGNLITVDFVISIDPTATSADTIVDILLPIPTAFASSNNAIGYACEVDSGQNNSAQISANTGNNKAQLRFYATDAGNRIWRGSFRYQVL